ncbi:MAG: coproporphyrinogen dehydrogenase HemZ [Oscillospiraceae bacterium]|nr:coproporphyrinogen dehydrogenase HemZ [Oscillospiraceae bacterium]
MNLCFTGNDFKYEMENIARLFYPLRKFDYFYDPEQLPDGDLIHIFREMGEETLLRITVREGDFTGSLENRMPAGLPDGEQELELGRLLYRVLEEHTGITPQWGILTGVRPVKWVQQRLRAGMDKTSIESELKEKLYLSDRKLHLAMQIADAQQELLAGDHPKDYSLYLSIPYCPSRCSYCSFVSHAITQKKALELVPKYVKKLVKEIYFTDEMARNSGLRLRSVHIGGGTPTTLTAAQLREVTNAVKACFPLSPDIEYTIEAGRADTIDEEKLQVIREAGAGRISINPQTFSDSVLAAIGRKHSAEDVVQCYELARKVGFDSINMDFIAGLPTDTYESFCRSIDRAVELDPENITVHTLSIKRSSALFAEGHVTEDYRPTQAMVEYAYEKLTAAGYIPYYLYRQKNIVGNLENVGYAKPGHFGRYNVYIMEEVQTILACGAGAVSKVVLPDDIQRVYNFKYPYEYISQFDDIIERKKSLIPLLESL